MTTNGWLQIAALLRLVALFVKPFGGFMADVFTGERTFPFPVLKPVERAIYQLCGVNETVEQHWTSYVIAMLAFSIAGFVSLYALMRLQDVLPFDPQGQSALTQDLSFNTAVSFVTNTNWQAYGGETTMSYFTQMVGLTVHNFLSPPAPGIALAIALIRGFARRSAQTIGNFWVDMTRATLYVLLPLSIVVALALVACGMPQNLSAYTDADAGRRQAAHRPGAGCLATRDQAARHEWRRIFQRQLGTSVRRSQRDLDLIEMWSISRSARR